MAFRRHIFIFREMLLCFEDGQTFKGPQPKTEGQDGGWGGSLWVPRPQIQARIRLNSE